MPNHLRFEIFIASKWDLCIYVYVSGDQVQSLTFERDFVSIRGCLHEPEACGVLELSC
jgi:hypothetical protein